MDKTKLVVFNEHTLGFIDPEYPTYVHPLQASVIKGSPVSGDPLSAMERIAISPDDKVRLASAADFNEYRVSFTGFDNKDEYEYEV